MSCLALLWLTCWLSSVHPQTLNAKFFADLTSRLQSAQRRVARARCGEVQSPTGPSGSDNPPGIDYAVDGAGAAPVGDVVECFATLLFMFGKYCKALDGTCAASL